MDIFERLKRFKRARQVFLAKPVMERAWILQRWAGLSVEEICNLSDKDQGRILFIAFYGSKGEELVSRLLRVEEPS